MFAVLITSPKPRGLREALRKRLGREKPYRQELAAGGQYWRAEVSVHRRRIPWTRLQAYVGERTPWLLPKWAEPPEGLRVFSLQNFREEALAASAVRILNATGLSPRQKSPVLVDRDGRYFGFLERLLPFCVGIKVVTGRQERYQMLAGQMLERFGAVVTVIKWETELPTGTLFLDPQGHLAGLLPPGSPVLTALPRQGQKYRAHVLTGPEAVPFEGWSEEVPEGIDFTGFLAACRATPGWKGAGETEVRFYCGEHPVTEAEIADYCGRKYREPSSSGGFSPFSPVL